MEFHHTDQISQCFESQQNFKLIVRLIKVNFNLKTPIFKVDLHKNGKTYLYKKQFKFVWRHPLMTVFIITLTVQALCWAELAQCVWRIQSLWQKKHRKGLELNHRVCGSRMPCQLFGDLKFNHHRYQSYFFWKMHKFFIRNFLIISHATLLLRKSCL